MSVPPSRTFRLARSIELPIIICVGSSTLTNDAPKASVLFAMAVSACQKKRHRWTLRLVMKVDYKKKECNWVTA